MRIKSWIKNVYIESDNLYVDGEITSKYNSEAMDKEIKSITIQDNGVVSIHTKGGGKDVRNR
jgi:hypothetical protein